ncbi:YkgJ family cysteine cluster protein [Dehalococcoides mccartyi]|nr:YkgJ family cysteine cluster protein [Dehalococcoides mccartyi]
MEPNEHGLIRLIHKMAWKKLILEKLNKPKQLEVIGQCNRCGQCCICWIYDHPDQPAEVLPRKGWCPDLDIKSGLCKIWENRPEGCRKYPTQRDFDLGAVSDKCGFRLVPGGNENG